MNIRSVGAELLFVGEWMTKLIVTFRIFAIATKKEI